MAAAPQPKAEASAGPGVLTPSDMALKPDAEIAPKPEAQAETKPATLVLASAPSEARELSNASPRQATLDDSNPAERLGRLYFGNNPVSDAVGPIQQWPMDEEVQIVPSGTSPNASPKPNDPDIKASAV